jgi:hypothetical protein
MSISCTFLTIVARECNQHSVSHTANPRSTRSARLAMDGGEKATKAHNVPKAGYPFYPFLAGVLSLLTGFCIPLSALLHLLSAFCFLLPAFSVLDSQISASCPTTQHSANILNDVCAVPSSRRRRKRIRRRRG